MTDHGDAPTFVCPSCGAPVEASWTYCHVCNYHPGDPPGRPGAALLPHMPPVGPPPGYPSAPPGPERFARLPPGSDQPPFTPDPHRGRLVVGALVVAVVIVVGGIFTIEAVTRPGRNNSAVFLPPSSLPSTTRGVPPETGVPGSITPGTTSSGLPGVPVPTVADRSPASTPAGWVDVSAPDRTWVVSFPTRPSAGRATQGPDGWEVIDVYAVRSPDTGATLRFVALRPTGTATVEELFSSSATFFATVVQSSVETGRSTTIDGKGARRFVATAGGTPTGALEAWAVYDGTRAYLVMSEASATTEERSTEVDLLVHSLRTRG